MLPEPLIAFLLGIVEGLTEFLPISSTGHLILLNQWIRFPSDTFTTLFDIVIQLGAMVAVLVWYRKVLCPCFAGKEGRAAVWALWKKLLIGVIPALVIGALASDVIERALFRPIVVALALIVGGVILLLIERRSHSQTITSIAALSTKTVVFIGLFQCLAMIPGTSRSAATIIGALLLGASRAVAVEFSFFLAVPTIAAASAAGLWKHAHALSAEEFGFLAIGFLTAFFVALFVIAHLIPFIQRRSLAVFAYYRLLLGAAVLLLLL